MSSDNHDLLYQHLRKKRKRNDDSECLQEERRFPLVLEDIIFEYVDIDCLEVAFTLLFESKEMVKPFLELPHFTSSRYIIEHIIDLSLSYLRKNKSLKFLESYLIRWVSTFAKYQDQENTDWLLTQYQRFQPLEEILKIFPWSIVLRREFYRTYDFSSYLIYFSNVHFGSYLACNHCIDYEKIYEILLLQKKSMVKADFSLCLCKNSRFPTMDRLCDPRWKPYLNWHVLSLNLGLPITSILDRFDEFKFHLRESDLLSNLAFPWDRVLNDHDKTLFEKLFNIKNGTKLMWLHICARPNVPFDLLLEKHIDKVIWYVFCQNRYVPLHVWNQIIHSYPEKVIWERMILNPSVWKWSLEKKEKQFSKALVEICNPSCWFLIRANLNRRTDPIDYPVLIPYFLRHGLPHRLIMRILPLSVFCQIPFEFSSQFIKQVLNNDNLPMSFLYWYLEKMDSNIWRQVIPFSRRYLSYSLKERLRASVHPDYLLSSGWKVYLDFSRKREGTLS